MACTNNVVEWMFLFGVFISACFVCEGSFYTFGSTAPWAYFCLQDVQMSSVG